MYCSSCGSAVPRNLSYCNRCGAKVGGADVGRDNKPAESFSESLVWAIVAVFVVGLGTLIGLMAVMKEVVGFHVNVILAVTALSFLLMLVVEGVLIRLLLNSGRGAGEAGGAEAPKGQATKELEAAQARVLPEPVPSVTEQTTRAFETIYRERKSE